MANKLQFKNLPTFFHQGVCVRFSEEEVVHDLGSDAEVFYIEQGFVKSYIITDEGNYNTLSIYGPGYVFPLAPILRNSLSSHPYSMQSSIYFEAMTDLEAYKRRSEELLSFADSNPEVYRDLLKALLNNYEIYLSRVEGSMYKHAKQRVARQLTMFTYRFASRWYGEMILDVPLTHQDLAETLGMARETVSRELEALKKAGVIDNKDQHIIVRDMERLQSLANGE